MGEACRVLAGGGELLIVGWNRLGWSGRFGNPERKPRLRGGRVRTALQHFDVTIERTVGIGLMGRRSQVSEGSWLHVLTRPVADIHLLHCRHESGAPGVRLVRFSRPVSLISGGDLAGARRAEYRREIA